MSRTPPGKPAEPEGVKHALFSDADGGLIVCVEDVGGNELGRFKAQVPADPEGWPVVLRLRKGRLEGVRELEEA